MRSTRYISAQTAIKVMLETGDKSVLKKTDPNKRHELAIELKKAQAGISQALQKAKPKAPEVLPLPGQSYAALRKDADVEEEPKLKKSKNAAAVPQYGQSMMDLPGAPKRKASPLN